MAIPTRAIRISGALILATLLVGGAYVLGGPSFLTTKKADAESTEALLASYAQKDTDGDGLPDWQEVLYGTDPSNPQSTKFGVSDGEAFRKGLLSASSTSSQLPKEDTKLTAADLPGVSPAPGSITEQFSQEFFKSYVAAGGGSGQLTADKQNALIASLMKDFGARASAVLSSKYTIVSVRTNPNVSVLEYADSVENIFRKDDVVAGTGDPIVLMQALMENNDETARPKLKTLASTYSLLSSDLLSLQVPPELVNSHLTLIRSFDSLGKSTALVSNYEKDPIGVMGALSLYQPSSDAVVTAIKSIAASILSQGEPLNRQPGALLVTIARSTEKP